MNASTAASEKLAEIAKQTRQFDKLNAELNEKITALKSKADKKIAPLKEKLEGLSSDLERFANEHKDDLLEGDKKSIRLASGELGWRSSKGKVSFIDADKVIAVMRVLKLTKFIRKKEEVNMSALNDDKKSKQKLMDELNTNHPSLLKVTDPKESFWAKPL